MSARRPLSDRIAELKANGPKPVHYERIEPQSWGASTATVSAVRLLRGRVLVEPLEVVQSSLIIVVDSGKHDQKSLAIGLVVAMGPPMQKRIRCPHCLNDGAACDACNNEEVEGDGFVYVDIPHGFEVGDVVLHVGQHRSRDVELANSVYRVIAQEEVQAVVEGDYSGIDVKHGGAADYRTVVR